MLIKYLLRYKFRAALYMSMTVASAVAYSALVVKVGPIFDFLAIGDLESMLPLFALLFFGLLAIRVMDYYAEALCVVTANRIRQDMKDDLFAAAIRDGDSRVLDRDSGEFVSDFTNDITMMESKGDWSTPADGIPYCIHHHHGQCFICHSSLYGRAGGIGGWTVCTGPRGDRAGDRRNHDRVFALL